MAHYMCFSQGFLNQKKTEFYIKFYKKPTVLHLQLLLRLSKIKQEIL
jgi:hypothetical protein